MAWSYQDGWSEGPENSVVWGMRYLDDGGDGFVLVTVEEVLSSVWYLGRMMEEWKVRKRSSLPVSVVS